MLGWANALHGEVGVDIFVILSGMGLTLSSRAEGAGRYLIRRFLRIYPAYWITLTVFLLAGALLREEHYSEWDVLLHYTGIHAWFGDTHAMSINDSFWFIREYNVMVLRRFFPVLGLTPWSLTAGMAVGLLVTLEASSGLHWLLKKLPTGGGATASGARALDGPLGPDRDVLFGQVGLKPRDR